MRAPDAVYIESGRAPGYAASGADIRTQRAVIDATTARRPQTTFAQARPHRYRRGFSHRGRSSRTVIELGAVVSRVTAPLHVRRRSCGNLSGLKAKGGATRVHDRLRASRCELSS